ncbi:transporter substrate-binding domain-containing protein [Nibrella viscosa]
MKHVILLIVLCLPAWGCDTYPKDPRNTLKTATGGTLRVGYSENPPWVIKTDSVPTGIEANLVKAFAATLKAQVAWHNDTEQNLFEDLEKQKLHLVIAGITDNNPWKKKVGLTRPFVETGEKKHVMAAIQGENAFIVRLERFLHEHEQAINARVQP